MNHKPKHTELDLEEVRRLWWSGEGMMQNPIKREEQEKVESDEPN